jgi:hypothetical protein
MSEMTENFAALKEISKAARASNRSNSAKILADRGVAFESKNDGQIVEDAIDSSGIAL